MAEVLDTGTLDALYRAVGDDPEFLGEVVDEYLADAPRQLAAMRRALATDAIDDLVRASHTLKGTSLNVGAMALAETCREIERGARSGEPDGIARLIDAAEEALGATAAALEEARASGWGDQ